MIEDAFVRKIRMWPWRFFIVASLVFGVAACGDASDADVAQDRIFSESLLEAPCELTPKAMLAEMFDIPVDEIRQTPMHILGAICNAEWEDNGKVFSMDMHLQMFSDVEQAAKRFAGATRSMTQEEMAAAAEAFKEHLGDGGDASDGEKKMTQGLLSAMAMQSTEFEDVAGLGDEARFDVIAGELVTRVGNLLVTMTAFHGDKMPPPDELSVAAVMKAGKAWKKRTMTTRRQQVIAVMRAVLDRL